jgi:hypothetical protein
MGEVYRARDAGLKRDERRNDARNCNVQHCLRARAVLTYV